MDMETLVQLERLNQISLTDEEKADVMEHFAFLEKQNEALNDMDTDDVERMIYVMPLENVLREDIQKKLFTRDELQEGAPEVTDGYWQVPRLLD